MSPAQPATRPRLGVFGIGLDAYWPHFPSLDERLSGYLRGIEERLTHHCALSIVSQGGALRKVGQLMGIETVAVA